MSLYFSYGSNMSESRMIKRGLIPTTKEVAFLDNYEFIINKRSYKNPKIGYANIIPKNGSVVEGILYEVKDDEIQKLDKFEGVPLHYYREMLNLRLQDGSIAQGVVYIANFGWTSPNTLKTTTTYKNFILEGKGWISENYFNFLNESIKV